MATFENIEVLVKLPITSVLSLSKYFCDSGHDKNIFLTKSEFMRKAIALMIYTMNYKKKGAHLAVLDKNDKKLADVVGL